MDYPQLRFERFSVRHEIPKSFDCDDKSLNDFIKTVEVRKFEEDFLGRTTLTFLDNRFVGYYTISNNVVQLKEYDQSKDDSVFGQLPVADLPAILIGRLAVDKPMWKRGIGSLMIGEVARYGCGCAGHCAIRLVIVHAMERPVAFYKKNGFRFMPESETESKRNEGKSTRMMYMDLKPLIIKSRSGDQPRPGN